MAAICYPDSTAPRRDRIHDDGYESYEPHPRPVLRVLPGGRGASQARASRAVYLRRRFVALAAAVVLLMAAAVALDGAGLFGDAPAPAEPARPLDMAPVGRAVHVVQPGETLWTIAARIAPDADPRTTVDALVDLNGSASLEVGQRLILPQ